jgi:DNA polymerase
VVQPELVVCLGATAAQAVCGPAFRLTHFRGELLPAPPTIKDTVGAECRILATVHPSAVLRAPDRESAYQEFLDDLKVAAHALG